MAAIAGVQVGAFILCGACLFMVGFDWQAMGYVAPAVVGDLNIPNSALGPVFGAANIGFSIGAVLAGMLADKIGRRPVLIGATVLFAVVTLFFRGMEKCGPGEYHRSECKSAGEPFGPRAPQGAELPWDRDGDGKREEIAPAQLPARERENAGEQRQPRPGAAIHATSGEEQKRREIEAPAEPLAEAAVGHAERRELAVFLRQNIGY